MRSMMASVATMHPTLRPSRAFVALRVVPGGPLEAAGSSHPCFDGAMTYELQEVAGGLGGLEGPVWTSTGSLVVTSLSRGLLYQIGDDGPELLAETGGGPNGLAAGPDGSIWGGPNGGGPPGES